MIDKVRLAVLWTFAAIGAVIISYSFGKGDYATGVLMIIALLIFAWGLGQERK